MKASNKKRLDISVLTILIFVVLGISYYSYSQYSKYNDYRQNKKQLLSLQSLHKLLGAIDAERELSALYIVNHTNKTIVSRLKKKQEQVDSIIETIKKSRNNLSKEFFFKVD
jgi:heme/copper-type cytochrome/quinol oxidase subunit 2